MNKIMKSEETRDIGHYRQDMGLYRLPAYVFELDVDYCDREREEWIWSIGQNHETGEIWAATDTRYCGNSLFECLYQREKTL